MRKIPYTDLEIYSDPRIPVVKTLLSGLIKDSQMKETFITIMPNNDVIALVLFTTAFCFNLKECIPGYKIIVDPRTFDPEVVEQYKITEDEFIAFNQATSSIYLNIDDANMKYFYNINSYQLIDKIEDLTSYKVFQDDYLTLKADDGCKFFRGFNNSFIIPIWAKFPNIAKTDEASLYVYKLDCETDLVVWKIYKKKLGREIYTVFRVMSFRK